MGDDRLAILYVLRKYGPKSKSALWTITRAVSIDAKIQALIELGEITARKKMSGGVDYVEYAACDTLELQVKNFLQEFSPRTIKAIKYAAKSATPEALDRLAARVDWLKIRDVVGDPSASRAAGRAGYRLYEYVEPERGVTADNPSADIAALIG